MSNPSKRKGTDAEVDVRDYLRVNGYPYAERLPTEGSKDRGDITGIPGVVIEIKACKEMTVGSWMNEVDVEKANAGADVGVVWHKRRLKAGPGDWFVTMSGADFIKLLNTYTD